MKVISILTSVFFITVQSDSNITECPPVSAQCGGDPFYYGHFPSGEPICFINCDSKPLNYPGFENTMPCWSKKTNGEWDCDWYNKNNKCEKHQVDVTKSCRYNKTEFECPTPNDFCKLGSTFTRSTSEVVPNCWKKTYDGWVCEKNSICNNYYGFYDITKTCPALSRKS